MDNFENKFNTLSEMYSSSEYDLFISNRLSNDLFISNPDRADRIAEAAEHGCDGSLHCEIIEDWREYLNTLKVLDDDYDPDYDDLEDYDIDANTENQILDEIQACEEWHIKNGSYEQQVG